MKPRYLNHPDCCGSGPCKGTEVRVLRLAGDGNLILCLACFDREIAWRHERNRELAPWAAYSLPLWTGLPIYRSAP